MLTSESLDDLTYDYEEDGALVRKQLERVVLSRGAWATVLFLYQELDRASGAYRSPKIALVRFQKWRGGYRKQGALTLSDEAQARELGARLAAWAPRMAAELDHAESHEEPDDEPAAEADVDLAAEA